MLLVKREESKSDILFPERFKYSRSSRESKYDIVISFFNIFSKRMDMKLLERSNRIIVEGSWHVILPFKTVRERQLSEFLTDLISAKIQNSNV